jgi:hypothetical protein
MGDPILIGTSKDHFGIHYATFAIHGKRYKYALEYPDLSTIKSIYKYSRWKALHYARKMAKTFSS